MLSKRLLAVALCIIICLGMFSGCGITNDVKYTEKQIKNIGSITKDSNQKIQIAEKAYDKLNFIEKIFVSGGGKIKKARKEYTKLVLDNADEKINIVCSIAITLDSYHNIKKAIEAVNNVPKEYRKKISNIEEFKKVKKEFNQIVVKESEKLISQIGEVNMEKEHIIVDARKTVNLLLDSSYITNISNIEELSKAEKELERIKEQKRTDEFNDVMTRVKKEYDKVDDSTRYKHRNMPYYVNVRSYVLPMIAEGTLAILWSYTGDDWIFWDKVIINIDGEKHTKSFDGLFDKPKRDNRAGDVWEVAHSIVYSTESDDYKLLEKIANSKETIVRFQGEKSYDLYVSASDKQAIKDMFFVYKNKDLLDN